MKKRAFSGFPKEGLQFLRSLKRHNNRERFQDHKTIYEQYVKQPMFGLIEALAVVTDVCWRDPGTPDTGWFPGRIIRTRNP